MTKLLTIAAAFIGTLALFYLFGAFVAWDKEACVALVAFAVVFFAVLYLGNRHD